MTATRIYGARGPTSVAVTGAQVRRPDAGAHSAKCLDGLSFRDVGTSIRESMELMLGVELEPLTLERPISHPAFAATVSLLSTDLPTGLRLGIIVGSSSVRELTRRLVGDSDLSKGVLEDFVREMANTAVAALKRVARSAGFVFTTGLPSSVSLHALAGFSGEQSCSLSFRCADSEECFTAIVASQTRVSQWITAADLHEGMVVFKDVRDGAGVLMLRAGARIDTTTARGIARALGTQFIEIYVAK